MIAILLEMTEGEGMRVQPESCGSTNLSVAGPDNRCKSPREALSQLLESRSQLCLAGAIFLADMALKASLCMRNTQVSNSATLSVNFKIKRVWLKFGEG